LMSNHIVQKNNIELFKPMDGMFGSPVTSLGSLRRYIHRCESLPRRQKQQPAVKMVPLALLN
jgi:hypothetical protein